MNIEKIKEKILEIYYRAVMGWEPGLTPTIPNAGSAEGILKLVSMYPELRKPDDLRVVQGYFELYWEMEGKHVSARATGPNSVEFLWVTQPKKIGTAEVHVDEVGHYTVFYDIHGLMFK